jgi:hypothetical protein
VYVRVHVCAHAIVFVGVGMRAYPQRVPLLRTGCWQNKWPSCKGGVSNTPALGEQPEASGVHDDNLRETVRDVQHRWLVEALCLERFAEFVELLCQRVQVRCQLALVVVGARLYVCAWCVRVCV